jgi:hypothetical protein
MKTNMLKRGKGEIENEAENRQRGNLKLKQKSDGGLVATGAGRVICGGEPWEARVGMQP